MTRIGRLEEGFSELAVEAAVGALADVDPSSVGRVYLSSFAPSDLCGIDDVRGVVARALSERIPGFGARCEGPFKTGGEALYRCLSEWDSGSGDALVVGCEKMTHMGAGAASGILARRVNPHDRAYGATLPALGALVTRAYQRRYSIPQAAFDEVAVKNHRNGSLNPKAHFKRAVTREKVATSPIVADPLRRLHCAPVSDGAAAILLGEDSGGVVVSGWGRGLDAPILHQRMQLERFVATRHAWDRALAMSKLSRADIDVIEIHDAFSPFELINLEELGFYPHGRAWMALMEGELDIEGKVCVNPSGGLKARGHPIGVCGLSSVVEIYEQLTFQAGKRQHGKARAGVVQSAGGVSRSSYVFALERKG